MWTPSPEQVDELRARGFLRLARLLDDKTLGALRAAVDVYSSRSLIPGPHGIIGHNMWRQVAPAAELIADSASIIGMAARSFLPEQQPVLFQDHLVSKEPGTTEAIQWHQDFSYWPLQSPAGITLWIALDDVGVDDADVDNGCLRYISGTHRHGECQPAAFIRGSEQPSCPDLPPLRAEQRAAEAATVSVNAGDAIVHDPLVWHMSPANFTTRRRRAWTLSVVTDEARWRPSHAAHPFLQQLGPAADEPLRGELFPRLGRAQ